MPDTTLEMARRCHVCHQPCEEVKKFYERKRSGMVTVYVYMCKNERCRSFEGTKLVQVNPDGTIPTRKAGPKEYPSAQRMIDMGKSYVDRLGAEVRRSESNESLT